MVRIYALPTIEQLKGILQLFATPFAAYPLVISVSTVAFLEIASQNLFRVVETRIKTRGLGAQRLSSYRVSARLRRVRSRCLTMRLNKKKPGQPELPGFF